jgi:Holliday junction resolvase
MNRSKMGKAAREKGKRRERWLVKELKELGIEAWRTGQYRAKIGESPDVTTNGRLSFEVKDRKSLSVFPAVEKMLAEADQFDIPIFLWYNPKYRRAVAVVDWADMKRLLDETNHT